MLKGYLSSQDLSLRFKSLLHIAKESHLRQCLPGFHRQPSLAQVHGLTSHQNSWRLVHEESSCCEGSHPLEQTPPPWPRSGPEWGPWIRSCSFLKFSVQGWKQNNYFLWIQVSGGILLIQWFHFKWCSTSHNTAWGVEVQLSIKLNTYRLVQAFRNKNVTLLL